MREGEVKKDSLWFYQWSEKHKRSRFSEGMPGSVLNNLLWEILLEMSNRQ